MLRLAFAILTPLLLGGCGLLTGLSPEGPWGVPPAAKSDAGRLIDADGGRQPDGGDPDVDAGDAGGPDRRPDAGPDAGVRDGGAGGLDGGAGDDGGLDGGAGNDAGLVDGGTDAGADAGAGAVCGDSVVEGAEECDDGNVVDRDGCASDCTLWWDASLTARGRYLLESPAADVVTGVPVALSVPLEWLEAAGLGDEACAVAADHATVLPLEVERSAGGDDGLVWVRLDALPAGSSEVYLYFGDATLCPGDPALVWSGAYRGVWHFEDATDSAAGISVSGVNSGMSVVAAGRRGSAASVSPSAWLEVQPPGDLWTTGDVTLEAWVRLEQFGSNSQWENTIFQAGGDNARQAYFFNVENDGRLRAFWEYNSGFGAGAEDVLSDASFDLQLGEWHHLALVRDRDARRVRFYVDGAQLGNARGYNNNPDDNPNQRSFLYLGGNFTAQSRRLDGLLDEVRVSGDVKSAEWIAVSHAATAGTLVVGSALEQR